MSRGRGVSVTTGGPGLAEAPSAANLNAMVVVVPLGATEQHGPHLPLGTDSLIAEAIAKMAVARVGGGHIICAPTIVYGASGEHQDFPGTLSIGTSAMTQVLVEVVRSATNTFRSVVFVNSHGGNADALRAAETLLSHEGRRVVVWSPGRVLGLTIDAHAGRTETSILLALRPDLVAPERPVGETRSLAVLSSALREGGVSAVSPNGVLGDSRGASREEGKLILETWCEQLCAVLRSESQHGSGHDSTDHGSAMPGFPSAQVGKPTDSPGESAALAWPIRTSPVGDGTD